MTVALSEAITALGVRADAFHVDEIVRLPPSIQRRTSGILYPYATTLDARFRSYDVLDVASHGLWPRGLWPRAARGALLVNRSHGLEHLVDCELRDRASRGEAHLSWKYPLYHGGFRLWEVRRSMLAADLCLVLNAADRNYAVEKLGVDPHRARVVDNGLPPTLVGLPPPGMATTPDSSPLRIVQLGSYIRRKGTAFGSPALTEVLRRHPGLEVSFMGTGVPASKVREDFPTELHARIHVIERFERDRLPDLLKGHAIILFPSLFEGFGMAVLEAMACGLAPVVTRIPGISERLTDGVDALMAPPGDHAALTAALETLVSAPGRLMEMRHRAHARAQDFTWSRIACQTLALYDEARSWRRAAGN